MARQTHLKFRSGRYYWRLRIPADLLAIAGRPEITRSLGTADHRTAKQLALLLSARATAVFQTARIHHYGREQLCAELSAVIAAGPAPAVPSHPPEPSQPLPIPLPRLAASQHRISAVIVAYCDEMAPMWTAKTRLMNEASLRLFLEHQGDKSITTISRNDLREFKDLVRRLPPNYTKRFPGKPMAEVAGMGLPPVHAKTVNKTLSVVSSLFAWAVRNGYCQGNPARGLAVPIRTRPFEERSAFTRTDLEYLFASPLYAGCRSYRDRSLPGPTVIHDEKWWLPVIAAHTGLRLEEIAQLQGDDVGKEDGIWCICVRRRNGSRLKTAAAERIIPLTQHLIGLGLTEIASTASGALWPALRRGSDGTLGGAFSKWFGRYMAAAMPGCPGLTFHSLRHSFAHALKIAHQPEPLIRYLLGHAEPSIALGRYGKPYPPGLVLAALENALASWPAPRPNVPDLADVAAFRSNGT